MSDPAAQMALFGRADLQVHTSFGDGMDDALTIFERVERHAFLDVIAITDHDDVRGALEARETYERTRARWGSRSRSRPSSRSSRPSRRSTRRAASP